MGIQFPGKKKKTVAKLRHPKMESLTKMLIILHHIWHSPHAVLNGVDCAKEAFKNSIRVCRPVMERGKVTSLSASRDKIGAPALMMLLILKGGWSIETRSGVTKNFNSVQKTDANFEKKGFFKVPKVLAWRKKFFLPVSPSFFSSLLFLRFLWCRCGGGGEEGRKEGRRRRNYVPQTRNNQMNLPPPSPLPSLSLTFLLFSSTCSSKFRTSKRLTNYIHTKTLSKVAL